MSTSVNTSLFEGLKTTSPPPPPNAPPHKLLAVFHDEHKPFTSTEHTRFFGLHHPFVCALAPPRCTARVIRLPLALYAQFSLDLLAGACALGCCILCLVMNQRALAGAYIADQRINVAQLGATIVFTGALAVNLALFAWLLA